MVYGWLLKDDWLNSNLQENNNEMLGVVKAEVNDMDRFLGRVPERKPKMRILANNMG